ncbi:MAG TPA: B12-binding domain-containing protein [Acidimicrobiales bacterium]|nr:B12-binding domain-containing protein [Acidimicrobiales bacterium]
MTSGSDDPPPGALTLQQVAERLGVHYMTAYRYVRTGQLIAARRAGRWTVDQGDLAAFESDRSTPPPRGRRRAADDGAADLGGAGRRRYRVRLLERLLAGDEAGAWRVVESALVTRMRPDRVHLDLLAPCLREIGDRWAAGSLSVGDEHVASAVAVRLAARLAPLCARRGRTRGTLVIGGSAGELHGLPLTLVTNVLRSRGWEVVELGPNTPAADVIEAVGRTDRLRAVGVSVGSDAAKESAARTLAAVRDRYPGVPLLAGGPGVPDATVARRLGGDGWAADADQLDALLSDMR